MIPPAIPSQYQPCFQVRGYEGWDAVASLLMPRGMFARRVAKKLVAQLGACRGFVLPNGSVWGIDGGAGAGGARLKVTRLV